MRLELGLAAEVVKVGGALELDADVILLVSSLELICVDLDLGQLSLVLVGPVVVLLLHALGLFLLLEVRLLLVASDSVAADADSGH